MSTEIVPVNQNKNAAVTLAPNFFALDIEGQIERATKIANALKKIVDTQNLAIKFQGDQEFLPVEVWQTLGMFVGVLPREKSVNRMPNGAYEAHVDLVKASDGTVIGGASAICGMDETWAQRKEFSRRSMAITRATGKAYRNSFSWIMVLAGYAPTPAEDMEDFNEAKERKERNAKGASAARHADSVPVETMGSGTTEPADRGQSKRDLVSNLKAAVAGKTATKTETKPRAEAFNMNDPEHLDMLDRMLSTATPAIPKPKYCEIAERFDGKFRKDLPGIIKSVTGNEPRWEDHA